MNILVINGSPAGDDSITLQTVRYLQKRFPGHEWRQLNVVKRLKALEKDFSELAVISAGLYRKKDLVSLKVVVDYRQGARPFPEVVSLFQQSVLEKLKDSFGIETVKEIEVCMRDSIAGQNRSEQ